MPSDTRSVPASKTTLWAGRVLTAVPVLFLVFDGLAKVMMVAPVIEACAQLDIPTRVVPGLGVVLIAATLLYAFPSTSILGAIVLTGYLGGATWTHVRMGGPAFPIVFPSFVAALVWGGLWLREPRLRALVPLRSGLCPAEQVPSPDLSPYAKASSPGPMERDFAGANVE